MCRDFQAKQMRNLEFLHLYQKGCVGKGKPIFKKGQGVGWVGLGGMIGGFPSWGHCSN